MVPHGHNELETKKCLLITMAELKEIKTNSLLLKTRLAFAHLLHHSSLLQVGWQLTATEVCFYSKELQPARNEPRHVWVTMRANHFYQKT